MGLQIEESDQELSARRREQQLDQQGAPRVYFSSVSSNVCSLLTPVMMHIIEYIIDKGASPFPIPLIKPGWEGLPADVHDVIQTHLDHVQMQQTFPPRLRQQRQSHKLRPQLFSRLVGVVDLLRLDFLLRLLRRHARQRRLCWLVVGREGAETNGPT